MNKQKFLDKLEAEGLPVCQLRQVLNKLYDGTPTTMLYLSQIRGFYSKKKDMTREHLIYMELVRNKLTGTRLVQFFEEQGGFLSGLNWLVNKVEGNKYHQKTIKIDEAY